MAEPDNVEVFRDENNNLYLLIVASQQIFLIHYVKEVDKLPLSAQKISQ